MTNLGLVLFWLLCAAFVLTAPREGAVDLAETVEVRRHCLRVSTSPGLLVPTAQWNSVPRSTPNGAVVLSLRSTLCGGRDSF